MPQTLQTFAGGTNILSPVQFPEEAKWTAGAFGASLSLPAGQVLAKDLADGLLYAYASGNTNRAIAGGLNMFTLATDASGNVFYGGSTNGSTLNVGLQTSPYFVAGTFDTADLTGWTTNSATSFGARTIPSGYVRIG